MNISKKELSHLRNRWTQANIRKIIRYLKANDYDALAGHSHNVDGAEYVDLRGIQPSFRFMNLKAKNVDFSYSVFRGVAGLGLANIRKGLFVGMKLVDGGNLGERFMECDFSHARMKGIDCIYGTSFSKCSFLNADMSSGHFSGVKFSDCEFTSSNFRRTQFFKCEFRSCIFMNSNFNDSAIGGTIFVGLKESAIWKDVDTDEPREFRSTEAQGTINLQRAFVSDVTFK